jgi:hypothetical protein
MPELLMALQDFEMAGTFVKILKSPVDQTMEAWLETDEAQDFSTFGGRGSSTLRASCKIAQAVQDLYILPRSSRAEQAYVGI